MSRRGPISRPPSRHRSQSQSTGAQISPSSLQLGQASLDDSGAESPRDFGSLPVASNQEPPRHATPRTLGVHTILNPPDPREQHSGFASSAQRSVEGDSSPSSAGTRQYGVAGSPYQSYGPGPLRGAPGASAISQVSSVPTTTGRHESPTTTRPFPPSLGATRRILTPRSPRSMSFSRVATPSSYAEPQSPFGYPPTTLGRPGGSQEAPLSGPSSMSSGPSSMSQQSPRTYPTALAVPPASGAPRSYSQAAFTNSPPSQFPQGSQQSITTGRSPPAMTPTYPQGQFGLPQDRGRSQATPAGSPREANLSTAIFSALQTGGGGVRGSEVQPHLTLQTNTGEQITVPLDVHQGSRQADEKRHRNAGASARFRARKKERDKDMRETVQRLESENRDLTRQNQELQVERDFYRNERNRLRELAMRAPTIRENAEQGPPSPRPTRTSAPLGGPGETSFGASSLTSSGRAAATPSPGAQQHPPPYSNDLERPSRRRRTDPVSVDFATAPYAMRPAQSPSTLPPIVTPGYTAPITSAPPSARLPPLRFDQATSSPTAVQASGFGSQTGPHPPPPLQTQFPPYGRPPHEAGWATGPREHQGSPGSS